MNMSRRLSNQVKIDIAIAPAAVSANGSTTPYFKLDKYDRALFVWSVASPAILTTSTGTLYQATNASAATSATAVTSGTAIVSVYTKAVAFTITPATLSAADTVSITGYDINGDANTALTFTAADGGTAGATASDREFSINDTAAGTGIVSTACTNLAAILNNVTYGVPGLYASASSTAVTCRAVEPGENIFTVTSSSTTNLTLSVQQVMGMIEVNASSLTLSSSFTHVALNVINESGYYTAAFIIRGGRKTKMPVQLAGALTSVGY
jgi:hypothetical protein